jgi:hypothetical protein
MTSKLSLSSSVSSATLVAINSISAATVAANEEQNHHAAVAMAAVATSHPSRVVSVEQDDTSSALDNTKREDRLFTPKSSTAAMKPDVGILSKEFSTKGREQPVDKRFTIHRKKRAVTDFVDVGILSNVRQGGWQWQHQKKAFDTNLHVEKEVIERSLQSEEELPFMCPHKKFDTSVLDLFNKTDTYFPKCRCPSPTTCGPNLCECLELDANGNILQCMDSLNQLCEGTKYIDGIPGPWSMEECLGNKLRAVYYCSYLPCFVDGGTYWQCRCEFYDRRCTEYRDARSCARSQCCQVQTDDEGREACFNGGYENYYDQVTSFFIPHEEVISRFNECSFNSDSDKSIVQCYCESFTYGRCVNQGVMYPDYCEAMNYCCFEQTEDDARLDCFTTRFKGWYTGSDFYSNSYTIYESCITSGKSSDQCKCDIQGLSNCVYGIDFYKEPSCDLFQCCQSQTLDEGRKDCLVQDEAQLRYEECITYGVDETCICDKSTTLCTAGHSSDRHCELSSCCQNQTDDTGRKECIGNFTTSQPSSAPSETTPAEDSIDETGASPTATSALPGTSSASIPTPIGANPLSKTTARVLAVAAITVWLLLT